MNNDFFVNFLRANGDSMGAWASQIALRSEFWNETIFRVSIGPREVEVSEAEFQRLSRVLEGPNRMVTIYDSQVPVGEGAAILARAPVSRISLSSQMGMNSSDYIVNVDGEAPMTFYLTREAFIDLWEEVYLCPCPYLKVSQQKKKKS